jgi:hypothetical protein
LEGGVEGKETRWAAHVSVVPENRRAGFGILFRQTELPPESTQDFTPAGVPDPSGHFLRFPPVQTAGAVEHRASMLGGKGGNFRREEIPQKSAAMVEAKMFAVFRSGVAGGPGPANGRPCHGSLGAKQDGRGAVAKEAGTDQDPGIVIEIGCGRTNFYTGD